MKRFLFILGVAAVLSANMYAAAKPRILTPGEFHENEVGEGEVGEWWAVCGSGAAHLKKVSVSVQETSNDHAGMIKKNVRVTGCDDAIFLIRNVAGLTVRQVPKATIQPRLVHTEGKVYPYIELKTKEQHVTVKSESKGGVFRVYAEDQMLFQSSEGEGEFAILWSGDLNGDGYLDLLVDANEHENVSHLHLFLSSPPIEEDGEPSLKEVAEFRTVGC